MWCIGKMDAEYRKRMYDILDLYAEPYDSLYPVLGIDEKPKQILGEKCSALPMKAGTCERYDYQYIRRGTANIFVGVEPKGGRRLAQVTSKKKKKDFAAFMDMVVKAYPKVKRIRVVLDNYATHFPSSFYETFTKKKAERLLHKLEFHYTPVHASWLDVAEAEIGIMDTECTGKRIGDMETLTKEVAAWMQRRNEQKKCINWKFTKEDANRKLARHYVT